MTLFALAAAALVAANAPGAARAPRAPDPVLSPIRLAPDVYMVQGDLGVASPANQGFNSNAAWVVTRDGVVVIDALGTPALGRALVRAIRSTTRRPIRRVVLTHEHADHAYGLAALKAAGAEVWARAEGREYLGSDEAKARLAQRRRDLAPWFGTDDGLLVPDRWITKDGPLVLGGKRFELVHLGPAHSPEDLMIVLPDEGVVFSGDVIFEGRVPFVGEADSKGWLAAIDRLLAARPRLLVSGHGPASRDPAAALGLTRDYLVYLRKVMGAAVQDLVPFDEAYAAADWSPFSRLPAFDQANRINAYGTYLTLEREMLEAARGR
jgi:glyoxylase-like metal-dependent hydrolase (beta-lactamase superfamily II)